MGFVKNALTSVMGGAPKTPDMSGQSQAAADAIALQRQMYEEGVQRGQPWLTAGAAGVNRLADLIGVSGNTGAQGYGTLAGGVDMTGWQTDPGYQFQQDEMQKAIERSAAARGSLLAPSTMKALQERGGNLAAQQYGNIYARRAGEQQDLSNRLAGLAGSGQSQSAAQTAAGQSMAANVGQTQIGLADAITAAELGTQQRRQSQWQSLLGMGAQLGGAYMMSDVRAKENIKPIGTRNGHKVYEFNYKGDVRRFEGVMAQDLLETMPDAVHDIDGVLHVDYAKVGFPMREVH